MIKITNILTDRENPKKLFNLFTSLSKSLSNNNRYNFINAKCFSSKDDQDATKSDNKKSMEEVDSVKSPNKDLNSKKGIKVSEESKEKLNTLLKTILADTKTRLENKENKIDFKLAVPLNKSKREDILLSKTQEKTNLQAEKDLNKLKLSKELLTAVKSVAATINDDNSKVESELVQKLKSQSSAKINLSELFVGMKIDRSKKPAPDSGIEGSRAQRVRRILGEQRVRYEGRHDEGLLPDQQSVSELLMRSSRRPKQGYSPIDLFGSKSLGIFSKESNEPSELNGARLNSTWDEIHEKELKLSVTHPPANGFEEMILWTEQGKFWEFPIDNEQGIEEEAKYSFADHVFLEPIIDSWCPKKGPIRHFMELVCVALQKNPYLSVPEKHEYLDWYHSYFLEKNSLIKSIGAGEIK